MVVLPQFGFPASAILIAIFFLPEARSWLSFFNVVLCMILCLSQKLYRAEFSIPKFPAAYNNYFTSTHWASSFLTDSS